MKTKWTRRQFSHKPYRVLESLNRVADLLSLPEAIRDRAVHHYQRMDKHLEEDDVTNHIVLMAYSLTLAVRESKENAPITLEEIAAAFQKLGHRVTTRSIIRQALSVRMKLPITPLKRRSEDYLQRVVTQITNHPEVSPRIQRAGVTVQQYQTNLLRHAKLLFSKISRAERGGRKPFIFTVAIVYGADQLVAKTAQRQPILTQRLVSKATNTDEYSVRKHYTTLLRKHLQTLVSQADQVTLT